MSNQFQDNAPLFRSKREQRVVFVLVFMGILSLTYGFFFVIDFLPEKPGSNETVPALEKTIATMETEISTIAEPTRPVDPLPVSIVFDTLGKKEISVLNPESRSISALDTALLSGVVRHPDSGDFQNKGTMFLLGHSSYLPNVMNKNFQSFNGIQKLVWGDTIRLRSSDTEYVYRVDRTYQTKATDAEIKITEGDSSLILATCNSFGTKDDRFVVEASLIESHSLAL